MFRSIRECSVMGGTACNVLFQPQWRRGFNRFIVQLCSVQVTDWELTLLQFGTPLLLPASCTVTYRAQRPAELYALFVNHPDFGEPRQRRCRGDVVAPMCAQEGPPRAYTFCQTSHPTAEVTGPHS